MKTLKQCRPLYAVVREAFDALWRQHDSVASIAAAAGLGCETVRRLAYSETKYPRAQTVVQLAEAAGFVLVLSDAKRKRCAT